MSLRCGVLLVLVLASTAIAQLRVNVALVSVVATVIDSRGRYVEGLRAEDFIVEEDGQVQTIAHFALSNDVPLSVGIVLDSSLSMEPRIKTASNAVSRFIRAIHKDDDIFLMTFDRIPALRQDFTDNRDKLVSALKKVKLATGTALYDAVDEGLKKVKTGRHDDQALLLITDGQDAGSLLSFDATLERARQSSALLYALGIEAEEVLLSPSSPPRAPGQPPGGEGGRGRGGGPARGGPGSGVPVLRLPGGISIPLPGGQRKLAQSLPRGGIPGRDTVNMEVLTTLTESSGGKAWLVSSGKSSRQLENALEAIVLELRQQYRIGYYPPHALKDGKWHRVDIRAKNPSYAVRARADYFGG